MTPDPDRSRDAPDDCPRTLAELSELRASLPEPIRPRPRRSLRPFRVDPHATTEEAIEFIRSRTREHRQLAESLGRQNTRAAKQNSKQISK